MAETYRVAVIGSTGRGDYGHGLDTVWLEVPGVEVVAVADDHPEGLVKAQGRLGLEKGYADYRQMLDEVKPDIVSIAPRWLDQHRDMLLMAATAGVRGVYLEKPLCRSMEEADSMTAACQRAGVKVAVAHQTRYSPILKTVYRMLHEGRIGRLLEIRARGKEDARGGGEDLWVLGTHVLNLMSFFAGTPSWCFGAVYEGGKPIDASHVHEGNEGIGPLAGDCVRATYDFEEGVTGYFSSTRGMGGDPTRFGVMLYGSEGVLAMNTGYLPSAAWLPDSSWTPARTGKRWIPVTSAGPGQTETLEDGGLHAGNLLACQDLIASVEDDRQPESSLEDAVRTTEMIVAVFESHRVGKPVHFPLQGRGHPLVQLY